MTATVSVLVFAHDHENFVARCIESMLAQSAGPLELIVVDDASQDGTWDVISRYASEPGVATVVRHDRNMGPAFTYVDGARRATGRYLVPLDADDYAIATNAIERALVILEDQPDVAFVHCAYDVVDHRGHRLRTERISSRTMVLPSRTAFRQLLSRNFVHHSGTLIRRDQFEEVGGYDASLENSMDWDLWLRLSAWHDVGYVGTPLYAYRQHPGQLHRTRLSVPEQQQRENLHVIDRAISLGPLGASHLRPRAHASNHLLAVGPYFSAFLPVPAFRSLFAAFREDPFWVIRQPRLYVAIARLLATLILQRRGYDALRRLRDALAAARS